MKLSRRKRRIATGIDPNRLPQIIITYDGVAWNMFSGQRFRTDKVNHWAGKVHGNAREIQRRQRQAQKNMPNKLP